MTDLRSGLSKAEFLLVSAREHADKQVERNTARGACRSERPPVLPVCMHRHGTHRRGRHSGRSDSRSCARNELIQIACRNATQERFWCPATIRKGLIEVAFSPSAPARAESRESPGHCD